MTIALRLNFTDVIREDSLKNIYAHGNVVGYQFDVRLSYYRGHFLSVINQLSVAVDGEDIDPATVRFELKGQEYGISQLSDLVNVFWPILEPATIKIFKVGGLSQGEHEIDFQLIFRSPYMPISETEYMPVDSSDKKIVTLKD